MEAVEPPASSLEAPAQAEDAVGHEGLRSRGLDPRDRYEVTRHIGVGLARVNLLDDDIGGGSDLGPEASCEGGHVVLGGGVLREVGHHIEAGAGHDVDHGASVSLQHPGD